MIGRGAKIDNLVQIAHNVVVGRVFGHRGAGGSCRQHAVRQERDAWLAKWAWSIILKSAMAR